MEIQYKISAAHEFEILELLRRTSDRFSPALETYVDLKQYAQKIYNTSLLMRNLSTSSLKNMRTATFKINLFSLERPENIKGDWIG
jgi:hypothetical protein